MAPKPKSPTDGTPETAKDELAENASKNGEKKEDEAVEGYIDGEESYSRDPDSVES